MQVRSVKATGLALGELISRIPFRGLAADLRVLEATAFAARRAPNSLPRLHRAKQTKTLPGEADCKHHARVWAPILPPAPNKSLQRPGWVGGVDPASCELPSHPPTDA